MFLFFSFNFFFCEISCLICCKLIPPVIYVTSTGWIIREVNYGSVFSKASLVVSLEIFRKINQANNNQITAACILKSDEDCHSSYQNVIVIVNSSFQNYPCPDHHTKIPRQILVLVQKVHFLA